MQIGIFPGTFDPITRGHSDLIARACQLFEKVIIAVAENPGKKPMFTLEVRLQLARLATESMPQVSVQGFSGLLVDFARSQNAQVIIRSLRSSADFEHESSLALMNQQLAPDIHTVFLSPHPLYAFISSTLVREIATLGGDISPFVHPSVINALKSCR